MREDWLDEALIEGLRLCVALNSVTAEVATIPEAEHALVRTGLIVHVTDPDDVLALGADTTSLRVALTRAVRDAGPGAGWALALPRHGRAGGLRGPLALTRAALEVAAPVAPVVLPHVGGAAWLPLLLGAPRAEAVQWRVWAAPRPMVSLTPTEAARMLVSAVQASAERLASLGVVAGRRPESALTVRLGAAYPENSQVLLDRALGLISAAEAALAASGEVIHSHAVLTRERELSALIDASLDVVQACVSWPSHLMRH